MDVTANYFTVMIKGKNVVIDSILRTIAEAPIRYYLRGLLYIHDSRAIADVGMSGRRYKCD